MGKRRTPNNRDYAVGYAKPPVNTRFQPGRSGNPKGRPKGSKNFATLLEEELSRPVTVMESGKRKKVPKRQGLAKQLVNRALSNDSKATSLVLEQMQRNQGSPSAPIAKTGECPEDALVVQSIVRRIRMNKESEAANFEESGEAKE